MRLSLSTLGLAASMTLFNVSSARAEGYEREIELAKKFKAATQEFVAYLSEEEKKTGLTAEQTALATAQYNAMATLGDEIFTLEQGEQTDEIKAKIVELKAKLAARSASFKTLGSSTVTLILKSYNVLMVDIVEALIAVAENKDSSRDEELKAKFFVKERKSAGQQLAMEKIFEDLGDAATTAASAIYEKTPEPIKKVLTDEDMMMAILKLGELFSDRPTTEPADPATTQPTK